MERGDKFAIGLMWSLTFVATLLMKDNPLWGFGVDVLSAVVAIYLAWGKGVGRTHGLIKLALELIAFLSSATASH